MKKYILYLLVGVAIMGCKKALLTDFDFYDSTVSTHHLNKDEVCAKLKIKSAAMRAALPDRTLIVAVLHYTTEDREGNEIIASGTVTYPSGISSFDDAGAVLAPHFTVAADYQVPSRLLVSHESLFALFGYVVVAPDYIGYGETVDLPHPYHHHELTARTSVDMLLAAKEYFASIGKRFPRSLRVVGYSEGGYAALSSVRYIEEHFSDWLEVKEVFAGAGAYDLPATYESFMKSKQTSLPSTIPMLVIGLDYGDELDLDFTKVFKEPLLSNYEEWIISKKYTNEELTTKIGSKNLEDFLAPELFDAENENTKKLIGSLQKNEMIRWRPRCKVTLVHGNKDSIVPYINSVRARDSFASQGCDVTLVTVENKDHIPAGADFYTHCMLKLVLSAPRAVSSRHDQIQEALVGEDFNYINEL